jgi:hypothetical protein
MKVRSKMINLVTAKDIMKLTGYSKTQSQRLIRVAKSILVSNGFNWYSNKRVGRVPIKTIEDILGFELTPKHDIIDTIQEGATIDEGVQNGSN